MLFTLRCTAGSNVVYTNHGTSFGYGIGFYGYSTAEGATFMIIGDDPALYGAPLIFNDSSTAGNSVIINEGAITGAITLFYDGSTAGNSTIFSYPNSSILFNDFSKGGTATLVADGGTILFQDDSTGETARIELIHRGLLNLTNHKITKPMSIGSLEGDRSASVRLGAQPLTIGGNDISTVFEGVIGGGGGSIIKKGNEALTLTGANIYRGGTTIKGGSLIAQARTGSATGTGPVNIDEGN